MMPSNAEGGFRVFRKAAHVVRGPEKNHPVFTILSSLSFLCGWKEKGWIKLPLPYISSALSLGIISALISKSVTESHCLMEFLVHS